MATQWVKVIEVQGLTAVSVRATDILVNVLSSSVLPRATIVAIKGSVTYAPAHTAAALVNCEVHFGLIVGNSNLVAGDFPTMALDGEAGEGYMYQTHFLSKAWGDGTLPIGMAWDREILDVRSKRTLKGVGIQTLFAVTNVVSLSNNGTLKASMSILLHIP